MITLTRKLKRGDDTYLLKSHTKRVSVRDKLLVKEIQEMETMLPSTCAIKFVDPHKLHEFYLIVSPDEGFWQGGKFLFHIYITDDYNIAPPTVKCQTKLWHPNISEEGDICLSLLRQNSIDGLGWAPTRRLKDVIWGLNSLFTTASLTSMIRQHSKLISPIFNIQIHRNFRELDLLNFEDPLNISAAEQYIRDRDAFKTKVRDYMALYSRS